MLIRFKLMHGCGLLWKKIPLSREITLSAGQAETGSAGGGGGQLNGHHPSHPAQEAAN